MEVLSGHHQRNVPQTQTTLTIFLQQGHQEIREKIAQAWTSKDRICQVQPPDIPGDRGTHGYLGYKGEKKSPWAILRRSDIKVKSYLNPSQISGVKFDVFREQCFYQPYTGTFFLGEAAVTIILLSRSVLDKQEVDPLQPQYSTFSLLSLLTHLFTFLSTQHRSSFEQD